jgi:hypothetical protein
MLATSGTLGSSTARTRHLVHALRRFDEHAARAVLDEGAGAPDRLVEAVGRARIGPRRDPEVGPARRARRHELREILLERHDTLAFHVAAPFRPHLVFEEAARRTDADELAHRPLDVERVPVPGVDVDQHGQVDRGDDARGGVEHLGLREQPEIGLAEPRRREAVARDQHGPEARLGRELCGQGIVDAGDHERAVAGEESADAVHAVAGARRFMAQIVAGLQSRDRMPSMERIVLPHCYRTLDPAVRREIVEHAAADGFPLTGILYRPPARDPDVVVLAMHPRADFSRHYLVPQLTAAGYAFLGATTRYLNHDADALHERLAVDVAGTVAWLRERGFRKVVLLANSGGGSLFAYYLQQAARAPERRTTKAPSGDRVPLDRMDLPIADGSCPRRASR